MMPSANRRHVLKGLLGGTAITVGLPFLEYFLNNSGTALASGAPLPVRFGTWFWGCGMTADRFVPKTVGADYEITTELQSIASLKHKVSLLSGFNVMLDGAQNFCHWSGHLSILSGTPPKTKETNEAATFDNRIADQIGSGSRFRSLEISVTGNPEDSYSRPSSTVMNPGEVSPVALYQRIFGSEFVDPNNAKFTPNPETMVRQSVISAVMEQHKDFVKKIGRADQIRLDQYLTSVRQMEQQLALQLQQPDPVEACVIPKMPREKKPDNDLPTVKRNHQLFAELLAMALACNQTRVFNLVFSNSFSTLRRPGTTKPHHLITHEEPVDPKLGYQPEATYFVEESLAQWGKFVEVLDSIPEGDGTLLDNCLVLALSDTQYAKVHSINNIPMFIAGSAGGKLKPGLHIPGNGDPVTRVGLTIQQVMGVSIDRFGTKSMETNKPVTDILA